MRLCRAFRYLGGLTVLAGVCAIVVTGCASVPTNGATASLNSSAGVVESDFRSLSEKPVEDAVESWPPSCPYGEAERGIAEGEVPAGLARAVATNGRVGYVRSDQLEYAEHGGVTNPDEAVVYMERLYQKSEEALAEQLAQRLPAGVMVSRDQARRFLDVAVREASYDLSQEGSAAAWERGIAELAESVGLSEAEMGPVLQDAFYAANDAVAQRIPVYEADGTTQIGEFAVGGIA